MKKNSILSILILCLVGCNLNSSSKGYEFSHKAIDALLDEVNYDESIVIKNALYHEYNEESSLNELVVMYYTYTHDEYGFMDEYLLFEFEDDNYKLTLGVEAEKYFYFATGMDNDNYISLKAQNLNNYLENK